jgi:hypothetical protein
MIWAIAAAAGLSVGPIHLGGKQLAVSDRDGKRPEKRRAPERSATIRREVSAAAAG